MVVATYGEAVAHSAAVELLAFRPEMDTADARVELSTAIATAINGWFKAKGTEPPGAMVKLDALGLATEERAKHLRLVEPPAEKP